VKMGEVQAPENEGTSGASKRHIGKTAIAMSNPTRGGREKQGQLLTHFGEKLKLQRHHAGNDVKECEDQTGGEGRFIMRGTKTLPQNKDNHSRRKKKQTRKGGKYDIVCRG